MIRKLCIIAACLAVLTGVAWADQFVFELLGGPGATVKVSTTDTAATAQALYTAAGGTWTLSNGKRPIALLVSCEDKDARFAAGGTTPTVGGLGHIFYAGASIRPSNISYINTLKFVSAVSGAAATLQMTPEY